MTSSRGAQKLLTPIYIHILLSDITAAIAGGVVAVVVVVAATVIVMVVTAFVAKRRTAKFSVHQDAR